MLNMLFVFTILHPHPQIPISEEIIKRGKAEGKSSICYKKNTHTQEEDIYCIYILKLYIM